MSLREKAREIRAAGVEERGNFTPTGLPLKIYKYWASNSRHVPAKENFCHFWRVVAFWAPLMKVRSAAFVLGEWAFTTLPGLVTVAAIYVLGFVLAGAAGGLWGLTFAAFFVPYFLAGILAAGLFIEDKAAGPEEEQGIKIAFFATAPISFPIYGIAWVISNWPKPWSRSISKAFSVAWKPVGAVLGAALILLMIVAHVWVQAIVVLLFAATLLGVAVGLGVLAEFIAGRRKVARVAAENAQREAELDAAYEERKYVAPAPGRVKRFFTGIGDLLIFVTQVVRVNKWKVCPLVDVNETVSLEKL